MACWNLQHRVDAFDIAVGYILRGNPNSRLIILVVSFEHGLIVVVNETIAAAVFAWAGQSPCRAGPLCRTVTFHQV